MKCQILYSQSHTVPVLKIALVLWLEESPIVIEQVSEQELRSKWKSRELSSLSQFPNMVPVGPFEKWPGDVFRIIDEKVAENMYRSTQTGLESYTGNMEIKR